MYHLIDDLIVDLSAGTGKIGVDLKDELSSIENVVGRDDSRSRDFLIGDAGSNMLSGMDGDDVLTGGDGQDFIFGDEGSDTVDFPPKAASKPFMLIWLSMRRGNSSATASPAALPRTASEIRTSFSASKT